MRGRSEDDLADLLEVRMVSTWGERVMVNIWRRKGAVAEGGHGGMGENEREGPDCWSSVNIVDEVWVEGGDDGTSREGEMEEVRWVEAGQLRMVGVEGNPHEGWNSVGGEWIVDEEEHVLELHSYSHRLCQTSLCIGS